MGPAPAGGGGALAALLGSLASLATSAAISAGQRAVTADEHSRAQDDERDDTDGEDEDAKDKEQVATGGGGERAPVEVEADPDEPQGALTAKLNTDTSPVPPAGTSPQDTK
jgi:hypothetical protein